MKTARRSDKVMWWAMGRASAAKHGADKATAMAEAIISAGVKALYLAGVRGEPRPRVRPTGDTR